jgi:hypothetical protein
MSEATWGRKETIIWPPHQPIYTLGAVFAAIIFTGILIEICFLRALQPLERFYLPTYIKTSAVPSIRPTAKYQLLLIADGKAHSWFATAEDVSDGTTPQPSGKPIPLALSDSARGRGIIFLYRGAPVVYQNRTLGTYLKQRVYGGWGVPALFEWPLIFGSIAAVILVAFAVPKDIRRRKEIKYGRRLKGPVLVSPKQFNKAVEGTGIGIRVNQCQQMLRIPLRAEDQHFEIIGDTGSGKTTIIMQMLRQIQSRGHSAILYDPACEFVERFYDKERGDIVLNPLDRRCPYWGPSDEQRPVWFVLDELASLQKLPQLHTAITENRKSRNPIVLGFQGKAQLEVIYGHLAEVMLSQPATKIFLKTTEPNAAEWVSRAIGKVEIERMKETHFDGTRSGRNFSLDRQTEPLVLDSEISGLENLHAYMKHGNYVARFSFPVQEIPPSKPKFIERLKDDFIVREPKNEQPQPLKRETPVAREPKPAAQNVPVTVNSKPAREGSPDNQTKLPFGTRI